MAICCEHCGAKRANLHTFTESAGIFGTFDVARCLLCGWQICRLKPWKRRRLLEVDKLDFDEEDELSKRFANLVSKTPIKMNAYLAPRY